MKKLIASAMCLVIAVLFPLGAFAEEPIWHEYEDSVQELEAVDYKYSCAWYCKNVTVMLDCGDITGDELDKHLESDLIGLGGAFVDAYNETGVCPYFLAAVCALESGWGTSPHGNNIAGLMHNGKYIKFKSKASCIMYLANLISNYYVGDGIYASESSTICGIAQNYNTESTDEWSDTIIELTERIENNGRND